MSGEVTVIIGDADSRRMARGFVDRAPAGVALVFREPSDRTLEQNDKLHALITDVARQVKWHGRYLNVEAWKDIFTANYRLHRHGLDTVPGLDGEIVALGMHTSKMGKRECAELIELVQAWGAQNGVQFKASARDEASAEQAA